MDEFNQWLDDTMAPAHDAYDSGMEIAEHADDYDPNAAVLEIVDGVTETAGDIRDGDFSDAELIELMRDTQAVIDTGELLNVSDDIRVDVREEHLEFLDRKTAHEVRIANDQLISETDALLRSLGVELQ